MITVRFHYFKCISNLFFTTVIPLCICSVLKDKWLYNIYMIYGTESWNGLPFVTQSHPAWLNMMNGTGSYRCLPYCLYQHQHSSADCRWCMALESVDVCRIVWYRNLLMRARRYVKKEMHYNGCNFYQTCFMKRYFKGGIKYISYTNILKRKFQTCTAKNY